MSATSLEIVHESPHAVCVDKLPGWLTIPGRSGDLDPRPCLVREVARRYPGKIWIVHRLDLEVSGLVLFARSGEAHRFLCGLLERRGAVKTYEAWTEGKPPADPGSEQAWEGLLVRGKRRVHESDRGKWSRTLARFRGEVAWTGRPLLAWELRPETGRPHQLRCQAAARGFAIAGDGLYGSTVAFRPGEIALRAVRLDLRDASKDDLARFGLPRVLEAPLGLDRRRVVC